MDNTLTLTALREDPERKFWKESRYLELRLRGAPAWFFRYTHSGKRAEIGCGPANIDDEPRFNATADAARKKARLFELTLLDGNDPASMVREKRQRAKEERECKQREKTKTAAKSLTLGRAIRGYHAEVIEPSNKHTPKFKQTWINGFENHLRPFRAKSQDEDGPLWSKALVEVTGVDLLEFFENTQMQLPHTALKMRQRLDAVFERGKLYGQCTDRPTLAIVRELKKTASSTKAKSHRRLPFKDAPAFMRKLIALDSTASRCLVFTVLTAARTGESIKAEWGEFDLEEGVWTVPAKKMKADEEHRVYLSAQALEILEKQKGLNPRWVFPSPSGKDQHLSQMGMLMALRRLKIHDKTTVHGLARGTFSTWANENGVARPDVVEAALAHREADLVRAAYNGATFLAERRALLQAWADFLVP
jgi:integrase